ncbi:serine hydrolase domain-containing protein [Steroidobacter sp.]|uniref:serine hydrolase domain-containing protein n=1 Tax=Steroidobacter sp. TaxID=1978227 RepID=UPI001A37983D|nr:serine hydrolase domain-containing protein [Steroidobacter sp.]MBL8267277.1 beta-lactamase family protein [Steroidobacter sp.]
MTLRIVAVLMLLSQVEAASADQFEPVREQIRRTMAEQNVVSISVAVASGGRIVWEESFGWADKEARVSATVHTPYSLASVSKPVTATGLMVLVERGRVDLDAPVNRYLGEAKLHAWVGEGDAATVRRVANHTSGLAEHRQFFFANEPYAPPSMDETIRRYANLISAPGEQYRYSNLGYGILDAVIARVSGQSYQDFMQREVFAPLGMNHSSVVVAPDAQASQAVRYDETGARIPFYDFDHRGASSVYACVHDLARFAMFHLKDHLQGQRAILSDVSIDTMHRRTSTLSAAESNKGFGVGWGVVDRPDGYHVISHTGGMPGVATAVMAVPDEDIAVAVLSNSGRERGRDPTTAIVDAAMHQLLPRWTKTVPAVSAANNAPVASELQGLWRGSLHTGQAVLPLQLDLRDPAAIRIRVGDQPFTLVEDAHMHDGWLHGAAVGELGTEETRRFPDYKLDLALKLRGSALQGSISAVGNHFSLNHWAELRKE